MHDLNNLNYTIINIFECDMVATIKVCNSDIYNMYCDSSSRFIINNFNTFNFLLKFQHESMHMWWIFDLNLEFNIWHLN
jgi:hypothetical protein